MKFKKTKIIATLWPATDTSEKIEALYNAGVNIVRINYSHSNYEYFGWILDKVQKLNKEWKTNLAILTDTKWPEIRTKAIEKSVELLKNEDFILTTYNNEKNIINNDNKKVIVCDYEYIIEDLTIDHIIDIDSGLLKCKVIEKNSTSLICKALNAHNVAWKRHLNLPWIKIKLPWITESDKSDIKFACEKWTDFIALSFVRNKKNIEELRNYLKEINAEENIQIISKIENKEALDNIDEIIEYSDWIMIARWDLWAEIAFETLPIIQRDIANKCKQEGIYFIVATQILETMINNPIPTRAEITDIFNAVMQKADCTMLSGETAMGKYPIEAIETMVNVLIHTESNIKYNHNYCTTNLGINENRKQLIKNAINAAEAINVKAMIVFSKSWFMAKTTAAFRPNIQVFSFCFNNSLRRKLSILFGLKTMKIEEQESSEKNTELAILDLKNKNLLKLWDEILILYGIVRWEEMIPNIQIIKVK